MTPYEPLNISGMSTGLVQDRQEFILPNDAYPILENAFVWRERIKRKQGCMTLGRLRRMFSSVSLGNSGSSPWTFKIFTTVSPNITEANATLQAGSVVISMGGVTFNDQGNGTLTSTTSGNSGVINYITSSITLTTTVSSGTAATISFNYYPSLPVMGLLQRQLNSINVNQTLGFDTRYCYNFGSTGWQEFIPGTTWTGSDSNFFFSTNYWNTNNNRLFWVTNFSGPTGDPIRYTDGTTWTNFTPTLDASSNLLFQSLAILPFRGRLLVFNTLEGPSGTYSPYYQRIRWSAIGNPLASTAWRDDIRGQGGFLDIPTSESITAVGFVRDNLVVYCQRSTWQLRYTGRTIAPFQIEKVNSELGAESLTSAVQFDTSLVGIGDKGIIECDSFKSTRIDIKIPNLVFGFNVNNAGLQRVYGVRDFINRLAFWTYPDTASGGVSLIYPNRRLVYNYENDSWAIFIDSFTCLGTFQPPTGRTWLNAGTTWQRANFRWTDRPASVLEIVGGNQQGFVMYTDQQTINDPTLQIINITGNTTSPTTINSPNHNLQTGQVISISGIPTGTAFSNLNYPQQGLITNITFPPVVITSANHGLLPNTQVEFNGVQGTVQLNGNIYTITATTTNTFTIDADSTYFDAYTSGGTWTNQAVNAFGIQVIDANNFALYTYSAGSGAFTIPQEDPPQTYIGGGQIAVRDNFTITSKKFSYAEQGESIQLGYIDVLMPSTDAGEITLNVYLNYNNNTPVNQPPENIDALLPLPQPLQGDTFFNMTVPTYQEGLDSNIEGTKYWQRVFCPVRGNFITISWTLSNEQLAGYPQESEVQIDSQILWRRPAGRNTNI